MSFRDGFDKTAGIVSVIGKGAKMLGKGLTRAASGNISKPLGLMDYAAAGLTAAGAAGQAKDMSQQMRQAAMR